MKITVKIAILYGEITDIITNIVTGRGKQSFIDNTLLNKNGNLRKATFKQMKDI